MKRYISPSQHISNKQTSNQLQHMDTQGKYVFIKKFGLITPESRLFTGLFPTHQNRNGTIRRFNP